MSKRNMKIVETSSSLDSFDPKEGILMKNGSRHLIYNDGYNEHSPLDTIIVDPFKINLPNKDVDELVKSSLPEHLRPIKEPTLIVSNHGQRRAVKEMNTYKSALVFDAEAGSGKTLLALADGIRGVTEGRYDKIVIVRGGINAEKLGFLPGDKLAKLYNSFGSIIDNLFFLNAHRLIAGMISIDPRGSDMGCQIIRESNAVLQFQSLDFLLGRSFPRTFILVDDSQEIDAVDAYQALTRAGEGSRIVFCGDRAQRKRKLNKYKEVCALDVLRRMSTRPANFPLPEYCKDIRHKIIDFDSHDESLSRNNPVNDEIAFVKMEAGSSQRSALARRMASEYPSIEAELLKEQRAIFSKNSLDDIQAGIEKKSKADDSE